MARPAPPPSIDARQRQRRRRGVAARATDGDGGDGGDSDLAYVAKLTVFSFAGAAAIKYGSLLFALPHEPSLAVALGAALGTPLVYGAWLLVRSGGGDDGSGGGASL